MSELWEDMGPQLWPAFWVTIQLTFWSAIGSLIWGTILAGMRVSPVPVMRGFGTTYVNICLLYTSPSPRDRQKSRMPSSA